MSIHAQQPSLAERFAFGRPENPARDPALIHVATRSMSALVGRILLAAIFLVSGIAKVVDPAGAIGHMESAGIPAAGVLLWIAAAAEIAGGLSLAVGFLARVGALGLVVYLIPTTLLFHDFWNYAAAEQVSQMSNFMKNLAVMGGLLLLYAHGPGRFSVDAKVRTPKEA
jgi:putative oxidoreductase